MADRQPSTLTVATECSKIGIDVTMADMELESHELFTPDLDSPWQPSTMSVATATTTAPLLATSLSFDDNSMTSTIREEYQPRTLGTHNAARLSILPMYPPSVTSRTTTPNLLLSNVPIESLTEEQYARVRMVAFTQQFKLEMNVGSMSNSENTEISSGESFLLSLYQNLYINTKKHLKVDIPIIDYNLTRLRNCIGKVVAQRGQQQAMLSTDELALALEFYLQIDVDMFFLKTCSFNAVQPRLFDNRYLEGLFCIDTPEPRFGITPCDKQQCLCCHSPCPRRHVTGPQEALMIPFSTLHIHRFVNQYEAILNCPATCETNNCIYVLTCPCGQYDFVGESKLSFAETLARHREEGNRIIREFLIGELNVHQITHGLKSDEKKANDKMWLYRHSPRCSMAPQFFLDYNPDYWCFIPMQLSEMNTGRPVTRLSLLRQTGEASSMPLSLSSRTDQEVRYLVEKVPKPPPDFDFSSSQRQQQTYFFKSAKDCIVPRDNVDLYNADIVAILPDHSSALLRQLIESLFITHAECKLNEIGHIADENFDSDAALRGSWCANLTRRPSTSIS